jgi:hypothetical protein
MLLSNLVEYFAGRAGSTMRDILKALPDSIVDICAGGDIQQALVRFGVLNSGLSHALERLYALGHLEHVSHTVIEAPFWVLSEVATFRACGR